MPHDRIARHRSVLLGPGGTTGGFLRSTGRIETAQEWPGHTSTTHTRLYIDSEDYRVKANGIVEALDISPDLERYPLQFDHP